MHGGRLVFDGFSYDVGSAVMPEVGPDGLPTGGTVAVRKLVVTDDTLGVEIVFTEEAWEAFKQHIAESRIVVASRLPEANGRHVT